MTRDEVEKLLRDALRKLEDKDRHLLETGANERSVTHRLAVYLERALPETTPWSVDCEFNRDGDETKALPWLVDAFVAGVDARQLVEDLKARTVFPDIIVHVRGRPDPQDPPTTTPRNLLVIEAKREGAHPRELERDRSKLRGYIGKYKYKHAYLIVLRPDDSPIERVDVED